MRSLWQETEVGHFPSLCGDRKTDVLIVGGGMFGVLTAYFLQKKGISYVLCEKDRICEGTTGHTTAKVTVQHGLIYSRLIREMGREKAEMYLEANEEALSEYIRLGKDINCDLEIKDNCIYSKSDVRILENELRAIESLKRECFFREDVPLPLKTVGAVSMSGQAQLDPMKLISELSRGLNIFENTHIREIKGNAAYYDRGRIEAENIVIATHFPFINRYGAYFLKLYQSRSFVAALEGAPAVDAMYMDESTDGYSFRGSGKRLLVGGAAHKTGQCGLYLERLREFVKTKYPTAREKYVWAAQDCMSLDGVPYIGRYSRLNGRMYTATGFNKWGMTSSMAAAKIIASQILGAEKDYASVFSPMRSILKPQLCVNVASAVKNLAAPTRKRCSHMGCALKWNPEERTWDCPCHGSRFSESGSVLNNPANKELK